MNRNSPSAWYLVGAILCLGFFLPQPASAARKVLRVRLDGPIAEAPSPEKKLIAIFTGEEPRTLYEWLETIDRAARDREIAGIALIIEEPVMSFAQAEELSRALKAFRASGKPVYCYLDYANNLTYLLACAADHITLAETSELAITGLAASLSFYKGLLDKIGVQADLMRCGAYKSAVEPFTRTEPSKEFAENVNWLLDGLFERWLLLLAEGRKLGLDQIRAAVDQAPLSAQKALQMKLVDEVSSFADFKQRIRKEFGREVEVIKKVKKEDELELDFKSDPFAIFQLFSKFVEKAELPTRPGVGIVYIEGGIALGKNDEGFFGTIAGSSTIRAAFEKARREDKVKAIVIRVDSPGGSALASDIMWKAARRCGAEKPVIVSMGGVAGSGGYYVSIPGDVIFAEESTLTGSIGVLGGKLIWKNLMEDKLGITTTQFQRGEHALLLSPDRPWTDAERQWMQKYIEAVYEQFKGRVLESRGDRLKGDIESLAGGRVYTGRQAVERGLVDRIGGLRDAIAYAAEKAGLGSDYEVYTYPEPKDFFEQLFAQLLGQEQEDEFEITASGIDRDPLCRALMPLVRQFDRQRAGAILRDLHNLLILQREHVGCFMPASLQLR